MHRSGHGLSRVLLGRLSISTLINAFLQYSQNCRTSARGSIYIRGASWKQMQMIWDMLQIYDHWLSNSASRETPKIPT